MNPSSFSESGSTADPLEFRREIKAAYGDVWTPEALRTLDLVRHLDDDRKRLMTTRIDRRRARIAEKRPIEFLDPSATIGRTSIKVADARSGNFVGGEIPADLRRQWIQGTGPAARPGASLETSLRNVAYALLSGADGWMFDGEDALGQIDTMSLDNQRSLKTAIARDPLFLSVVDKVADEMNAWSVGFFGRKIIDDPRRQIDFTTTIFRPRGLHLDDRHVRHASGAGFSASIVDATLYVANNFETLRRAGRSCVLYLPKIQTAEEAALWQDILSGIEAALSIPRSAVKTYVLVEQIEAAFQLMEIRAALGERFVGFNTGRWDYINSVADAMSWKEDFVHPNIDAVLMTYGYMRSYEDRVRRAVNTKDRLGRCALWQGGMEPNIPVGTEKGVAAGMKRAVAGAEREQAAGASGKWVAHWKMVHVVRPVWEKFGVDNQLGREFPPLGYSAADAAELTQLEPAPRTIRGARDLVSVAIQYGNAFLKGMQAAALKPADFFGQDDVLYLMEDMATGEIRLSIFWEWIKKAAPLGESDDGLGLFAGRPIKRDAAIRLIDEEFEKLLRARDKDVHEDSKTTTLPIAKEIVRRYVLSDTKAPWFIDLLNLNLGLRDPKIAAARIELYLSRFRSDGSRVTENLDF